jgi:hypothetical protein
MFVEINYAYQALFGTLYIKPMLIHYVASYVVRDTRDYSMIYNPALPSPPRPAIFTRRERDLRHRLASPPGHASASILWVAGRVSGPMPRKCALSHIFQTCSCNR